MKYSYGTKDSYNQSYMNATASELAEKVIKDIKQGKWDRYYGGEIHSVEANIDYCKPGYSYNNNLIIMGSNAEFMEFEGLIKDYVEYFTPRKTQ